MLQRRIIPSLLVDSCQHLVKTTSFSRRKYVGDPRNACNVLSFFQADEILVLDIDATSENRSVNLELVKSMAEFSSVPLAVGGGIQTLKQIEKVLSLGVERVVLGSVLRDQPNFLNLAANSFGSSSISVIANFYEYSNNVPMACFGKANDAEKLLPLLDLAIFCQSEGAGEFIVNDVMREGTRQGFDGDLMSLVSEKLTIPLIALGGGNLACDVQNIFQYTSVSGVALGSAFVYVPETDQVLINYPQFKAQVFNDIN